jgi:hypothetical protein
MADEKILEYIGVEAMAVEEGGAGPKAMAPEAAAVGRESDSESDSDSDGGNPRRKKVASKIQVRQDETCPYAPTELQPDSSVLVKAPKAGLKRVRCGVPLQTSTQC